MTDLKLDRKNVLGFISENMLFSLQDEINSSYNKLIQRTGKGNDFLGWIDLPSEIESSFLAEIEADARRIAEIAEIFVVVGIGGSYLGARAVIEALSNPFNHLLVKEERKSPMVIFAGNNLSQDYHAALMQILDQKEYAIAVISKSGTTTEPAVAFRILRDHLETKYGKEGARERIISITDKSQGALKQLSENEGYKTYIIPDDIGGRYSVLTPVGLIPIAIAGFNIRELINGAKEMEMACKSGSDISNNPACEYAALRNLLYRGGKSVEILVNYEPALAYITEWWKQLYGESEGKDSKGIFPAGVNFTSDLHSMGQYIQEGRRILFETVIKIEAPLLLLNIPLDPENLDGLNFISGKSLHEVNDKAALGTAMAHVDGQVPNIAITLPRINENTLGQLLYFFEFACGVSGYMLGVNPFDQPGVEAYKKNMFALLGKPGYEKETETLLKRIS